MKPFKSLSIKRTADGWGISVEILSSILSHIAPQLVTILNRRVEKSIDITVNTLCRPVVF